MLPSVWLGFFFTKENFDLFSPVFLMAWAWGLAVLMLSSEVTASALVLQILVKTMIRKRSFGNPFEGSKREERSLSASGNL